MCIIVVNPLLFVIGVSLGLVDWQISVCIGIVRFGCSFVAVVVA